MTTEDPQERRRLHMMRIAWLRFFLGPALLLSGWYLGAIANFEFFKPGDSGLAKHALLGSWICFLGGFGSVAGFVGLSLRFGRRP